MWLGIRVINARSCEWQRNPASNISMYDPKNHNHFFVFLSLIRQIVAPVLPLQFRLDVSV
jgi:hypothetical protein